MVRGPLASRRDIIRYTNSGGGLPGSDSPPPVGLMGPHTASLGMRFYTGNMFPKSFKNAIIVARHGSWNRSNKAGGDVVVVKLNNDGTVKSIKPFITGFPQTNKNFARPAHYLQLT